MQFLDKKMDKLIDNGFLPDYKDDAEAYELEERSRPDEMLMINTAAKVAVKLLDNMKDARVLDLCCGTGLSMEGFMSHSHITKIVGVDISKEYLQFAENKFLNNFLPPVLIQDDAVTVELSSHQWDIIMLASAYHHIEDARKLTFLKRLPQLLSNGGRAIFAENILPEYEDNNRSSYAQAVRAFYEAVLETAKRLNPGLPPHVEGLIQRVAKYGVDGEYEYKVCYKTFLEHLHQAGLEIVSEQRVWPEAGTLLSKTTAGNYIIEVKTAKEFISNLI